MIKCFLLLLMVLILLSCDDNNENVSFPRTLTAVSLELHQEVRMFTRKGEIKDPDVIRNFLETPPEFYDPDYMAVQLDSIKLFLTFIDESTVLNDKNDTLWVKQNRNKFVFYRVNKRIWPGTDYGKCFLVILYSAPIFYQDKILTEEMTAEGDNKYLKLELYAFKYCIRVPLPQDSTFYYPGGYEYFRQITGVESKFAGKEDLIRLLRGNDTIAIKEYYLLFE